MVWDRGNRIMPRYINPVPQYHDSQGNILVEGFLLFEESGTNTKKDIYHDVDLTIAATNPVKLDGAGRTPSLFTEGLYKVTAYKDDGLGAPGEQQWSRDPVGDDADGFGSVWGQTSTYALNDVVQGSDGEYYISIIAANKGNDPTTTPSAWSRINLVVDWNTNETYGALDLAKGSDGIIYSSVAGSNQGNDPVGDAVNWGIMVPDAGITNAKIADSSVNADKIDGTDAAAIRTKIDVYSKAESDDRPGGLIAEAVVSGAAVTTIDISGLDINSHSSYRIEFDGVNGTASFSHVEMTVEGDHTTTNYDSQLLLSAGSTTTSARANNARIASMEASDIGISTISLRRVSGKPVARTTITQGSNTLVTSRDIAWAKRATVTNITSIRFTSVVALALGVGTAIRVYRG
jgi:hypothetical protein